MSTPDPRVRDPRSEKRAPPARLLVIDDEPLLLGLLKQGLAVRGEVCAAASADEALGWLRAGQTFDAVVCDVMMPGMTGVEFFAVLEREFPHLAARVVFLSGGVTSPAAIESLRRLRNPLLAKPFRFADLERLIDRCLIPGEVRTLRTRFAEPTT